MKRFLCFVTILMLYSANSLAASPEKDLDDIRNLLVEAEQVRAREFAPNHFERASEAIANAKSLIDRGKNLRKIRANLNDARQQTQEAIRLSIKVNQNYAELVESWDRMRVVGMDKFRKDLNRRAKDGFARFVDASEAGNTSIAQKEAKMALKAIHAAEFVASREQIIKPLIESIAKARQSGARTYAPQALDRALKAQKESEALVKDNPRERTRAHNVAKIGEEQAQRAVYIAKKGKALSKSDKMAEVWIDADDAKRQSLASLVDVQFPPTATPDEQFDLLRLGISAMKTSQDAQLSDAEMQIQQLGTRLEATSAKLSKYEGDLATQAADLQAMADLRRKLQAKRDAEAKIKRIATLFDRSKVEILLTTDADVILRLNGLNFLSSSAVVPPDAYAILDGVFQALNIFPLRDVHIEGHTDSIGSNPYNQELSERRAKGVEEYLDSRMGQNLRHMKAIGYGEDRPIANNENREGRKKNRRIDIVLPAPRT